MLVKFIRALKNLTLTTSEDMKILRANESTLMRFADQREFDNFRALGNFVEESGPPPAVIDSPKASTIPVVQPSKPQPLPGAETIRSEAKFVPDDNQKSKPAAAELAVGANDICEKCGKRMLPVTDNSNPAQVRHLLMCPGCKIEREIGAESKAPAVPAAEKKAPRTLSRCPLCGKVKSATAEVCKACAAANKVTK